MPRSARNGIPVTRQDLRNTGFRAAIQRQKGNRSEGRSRAVMSGEDDAGRIDTEQALMADGDICSHSSRHCC
jgi:hypothetical protein